jgi:RimJ/RimL family protein N-acetyltransferase
MTLVTAATSIPTRGDRRCANADLRVRPIELTDAAALVRFHAHLSDRSVQLRYFYPHRELGPDEVAHLTCVDGYNRAAFVVEHQSEIIAVGRYDRLDDHCCAEVAFVVADEFQHHGLGTMLLRRLVDNAKQAHISELKASVLAENTAMLAVFRRAGFPMTQTRACEVVELTMRIGPRGI